VVGSLISAFTDMGVFSNTLLIKVFVRLFGSLDLISSPTYFNHFDWQEKNTTTSVQDEFMQLLLWGKAR